MNDLIVKDVPFCGTELLAVQQKESGKIYVGINSILRELGFDEKQIEYRRDKWRDDKVLGKGIRKFSGTLLGAKTGKDVSCMEIKRLPLALAKIDVTPKMAGDMPDLAEKLEKYQDECADVLAQAFLPQTKPAIRSTKRIGKKKTKIKLYRGENSYILMIGNDVYDLEEDEYAEIDSLIPELVFMNVSQIASVVRAHLSIHENKIQKLECEQTIECDE